MTSASLLSINPKLPACHPIRERVASGSKANHHARPKSSPEMICFDMASWYPKFGRIRHSICPHNASRYLRRQSPVVFQKMHQVDQGQAKLHDQIFYERQPVPRRHSNSCVRPRRRHMMAAGLRRSRALEYKLCSSRALNESEESAGRWQNAKQGVGGIAGGYYRRCGYAPVRRRRVTASPRHLRKGRRQRDSRRGPCLP